MLISIITNALLKQHEKSSYYNSFKILGRYIYKITGKTINQ